MSTNLSNNSTINSVITLNDNSDDDDDLISQHVSLFELSQTQNTLGKTKEANNQIVNLNDSSTSNIDSFKKPIVIPVRNIYTEKETNISNDTKDAGSSIIAKQLQTNIMDINNSKEAIIKASKNNKKDQVYKINNFIIVK
jgi:hypothetical protein